MKLESFHSAEEKRLWRIVRLDTFASLPGEIVNADEATGTCMIMEGGETKTLDFGPGGIRLVGVG